MWVNHVIKEEKLKKVCSIYPVYYTCITHVSICVTPIEKGGGKNSKGGRGTSGTKGGTSTKGSGTTKD